MDRYRSGIDLAEDFISPTVYVYVWRHVHERIWRRFYVQLIK